MQLCRYSVSSQMEDGVLAGGSMFANKPSEVHGRWYCASLLVLRSSPSLHKSLLRSSQLKGTNRVNTFFAFKLSSALKGFSMYARLRGRFGSILLMD